MKRFATKILLAVTISVIWMPAFGANQTGSKSSACGSLLDNERRNALMKPSPKRYGAPRSETANSVPVQKGSSDPFSMPGDRVVFEKGSWQIGAQIRASNIKGDLAITAKFKSGASQESARIEIPHLIGEAYSVVLSSNPDRIDSDPTASIHSLAGKNDKVFPLEIAGRFKDQEAEVIRERLSQFYGFHFVAESHSPAEWNLVVTTDVSEQRSRELGGMLTYAAAFTPPGDQAGYIALPMEEFKPMLNGKVLIGEPGLGDPKYPAKTLKLRSIAFEAKPTATSSQTTNIDLRLRHSEVDMGFIYGMPLDAAVEALNQMADITGQREYRTFATLLLRMRKNAKNFPEGNAFKKLKTDEERREFLNASLSQIQGYANYSAYVRRGYGLGAQLGVVGGSASDLSLARGLDNKVSINALWTNLQQLQIPVEVGDFGKTHGKYTHALQFIAMMKGASDEELYDFRNLVNPQLADRFEFFWNIGLDARTGDVNDPAWWRERYEPALPDPEPIYRQ